MPPQIIRTLPLLLLLVTGVDTLGAHELITTGLTWTEQVSRIFRHKCMSCHREGGNAPMALETYKQVRPWATAIKREVLSRSMPPWFAVKGFGFFQNDLSLSQEDIAVISSWVEGGAPEGDPAFLADPGHDHVSEALSAKTAGDADADSLTLGSETVLETALKAVAIRPEKVAGGSLQAVAYRPDGSVEHLLWLKDFDPAWSRPYVFREPVDLPAGTKILLKPEGAAAVLITTPEGKR